LQAQPVQVLSVLLQHAGEVVTREQLQQAVWGTETFVDFEQGLNYCIAQIRMALRDSAESPRFVRTIPKRGYQFVAPVAGDAVPGATPDPIRPERSVQWNQKYVLAAALVALVFTAAVLISARLRPTFNVAVARFDNETGSPEMNGFADGLTDAVVAELTSGSKGRYGIIGNAATLRRPREERDLKTISSSLDAGYVILGQVQQNSSHVRVLAHLIRLPQQTHIAVVRFDRDLNDQLQTESELARLISTEFLRRLATSPKTARD
jgi:DNA-binding winged helix-turn-helix (wHTH) protein/TolB-like protein